MSDFYLSVFLMILMQISNREIEQDPNLVDLNSDVCSLCKISYVFQAKIIIL